MTSPTTAHDNAPLVVEGDVRSIPRVPTWVVIVSLLVLVTGSAVMFLGGWFGGITWDEKSHVLLLQSYFDHGWNVSPDGLVDGAPDPNYIWGVYVYGPVAELLGHVMNVVLGIEEWGHPRVAELAYSGRHLATGLIGLVGMGAVAASARVLLGSWRWGAVAVGVLASVPLWTGHAMFNIKDTPVASGYTLATFGIVLIARPGRLSVRSATATWASVILGTVLASGTRSAAGVPIAVAAVATAFGFWLVSSPGAGSTRRARLRPALVRLLNLAGALVLAYLALVAIYPKAFANPVRLAYEALIVSARFPFDETVLTNGTWMGQPPPLTYLPLWFGAQLPVLVIVMASGFALWWVVMLVRLVITSRGNQEGALVVMAIPVILQLSLLPALAIAGKSNMYNGSRQFLFVVPAATVLCVTGVALGLRWFNEHFSHRWSLRVAWVVIVIGVLSPTVAQVQLFPYTYTYFNLPTAVAGVDGRWPVDYWRQSARELVTRIPKAGVVSCGYEQYRKNMLWSCFREPQFAPYLPSRGHVAQAGTVGAQQYWYVRENAGWIDIPIGCEPFDAITRRLYFTEVTVAQILRCNVARAPQAYVAPAE